MSALELVVAAIRDLAPGIKGFTLRRGDGGDLPAFSAGAHIDVEVKLADGKAASRSYSITSAPTDRDRYEIAVLREPRSGGGSVFMHDRVKSGDRLRSSGPANDFPLAAAATEHLLIAGGIGITPILAMLRVLTAQERRFELHYCARSHAAAAFADEVVALAGARARFHFDGGDPRRGLDLAGLLETPVAGRHLYVCGPKAMIEAAVALCHAAGWASDRVHIESFAAAATVIDDQPIEVVLARSGRSIAVPADKTILEALIEAGEDPMSDCRRGECGICVVPVIEGEPVHRDHYLTEREKAAGKLMCLCISRARGKRLVVDL
jgi:vanillate monooxygenase ferredoxin subunit